MKLRRIIVQGLLLLACIAVFVPNSQAQFRASIQGTVLDAKGGAVAGAKVTATDQATGVSHDTVTNDLGFYRVNELPPGTYTVLVEATGFKQSVSKDLVVEAEQPQGLDVKLDIGAVNEQVTVSANNEGLQTEDASVATSISRLEVERLPEFGRDPYELVRLVPGVFGDGARTGNGNSAGFPNGPGSVGGTGGPGGSNTAIFQTENQQPISANGQRPTSNDYSVDGVSVNSLQWGGAAVITPSIESVQEINVITADYDAADGRSSGAHINVITKSGSNQFHGAGFFQYQTPNLNAYNKFNGFNTGSDTPDPTVRNDNAFRQFGGSLGGPVIKNKFFFFFNYEGLRDNATTFSNQWVDTPQFDALVLGARPNTPIATILSSKGIAPRVVQVLPTTCTDWAPIGGTPICQVVPGTNGDAVNIGSPGAAYGTYIHSFDGGAAGKVGGGLTTDPEFQFAQIALPNQTTGNQYNIRADYTQGKNSFAVSTFLTHFNGFSADSAAQGRPMADTNSKRFSPSAFLSWVRTFTPTLTNEARFNFTRFAFDELAANPQTDFGIPRIEIQGLPISGQRIDFGAAQGDTSPGIFAQNTFGFRDMVSKIYHQHAMRFGFEVSREQDNDDLFGSSRPDYVFQEPWNFANGTPIFEALSVAPSTGGPSDAARHFRTSDYGIFFQDDWKFRPNLTFNIGFRYEYYGPPTDALGQLQNLIPGSGPTGLQTATAVTPHQMWHSTRRNLGPRLGFAWSPDRFHSKAVVRGGFGIAFDRFGNIAFDNTRNNPPLVANYGICCGTASTEFGSPFKDGQILFATGTSNSPLSYPANPALITPLDPATNLPTILPGQGPPDIWSNPVNMPIPYIYLYSLQVEYTLPKNWIATIGYQGSSSHKLLRIVDLKYFYPVPNPFINNVFTFTPDSNANFNALNVQLEHRFQHGFLANVIYTYSKSMDQVSAEGPGFGTNQTYPIDQRTEWGPSDYNATNYVRVYGLWDLPIFRNRHDFAGKVFGGWQLNGTFLFHSGFPWTPVADNACPVLGSQNICPIRPIGYLGGGGHNDSNSSFVAPASSNFPNASTSYFNLATNLAPGEIPFPGIGRNSFIGPRYSAFDFSVVKQFGLPSMRFLGENAKIDLRLNAYNAFNKLNVAPLTFGSSSTVVSFCCGGTGAGGPQPNRQFGIGTQGLSGRTIELQGRISF
jgi:hypothetical protein